MSASSANFLESLRNSPLLKGAAIGLLLLLLQIPILLIYGLLEERDRTRQHAVREVADKWGGPQQIVGPFLVVPYRYFKAVKDNEGVEQVRTFQGSATFLPESLDVDGTLNGETRYRGIYEVPVYSGQVKLSGSFSKPDLSRWEVAPENILWEGAQIVVEVSDARAIQNAAALEWGAGSIPFEPGSGEIQTQRAAVHAPLGGPFEGDATPFEITLTFNGSSELRFAPLGKQTAVTLRADWADPSFQGAWLPTERDVSAEGFTAAWNIPYLGRNYPQSWTGAPPQEQLNLSLFGVDFITPVDAYRQSERSIKYEVLFLALTFTPLWLFEVVGGLRLHFIQYGLIGLALCLFYLLELSLAEHIGFAAAYVVAAAMIVGLVCFYGASVFKSFGRATLVGGLMAGFYAFLFILIRLEDYALIVGALGLFVLLSALMWATRKIDWFQPTQRVSGSSISGGVA